LDFVVRSDRDDPVSIDRHCFRDPVRCVHRQDVAVEEDPSRRIGREGLCWNEPSGESY
jgi:hypothetical protein